MFDKRRTDVFLRVIAFLCDKTYQMEAASAVTETADWTLKECKKNPGTELAVNVT